MRNLEIISPGITSELQVRSLESSLGGNFPEGYREFLLRYNGGEPTDTNNYVVPDFKVPGGNIVLQYFFSVENSLFPDFTIDEEVDSFNGELPPGLLPFALDDFGNRIVLGLECEASNQVYFWNHEIPISSPFGMHLIFRSFETFIDRLGKSPRETD